MAPDPRLMALEPSDWPFGPITSRSSSEDSKYRQYLNDLGLLIRKFAMDVKDLSETCNGETRIFLQGQLFAYAEIISLMRQEGAFFGIGPEELHLDGAQPVVDLFPGIFASP